MAVVLHFRLTHPRLDFWIDVRIREFDGRWLAVADLADAPDVGTGEGPQDALRGALAPFGPVLARQLTDSAKPPRAPVVTAAHESEWQPEGKGGRRHAQA